MIRIQYYRRISRGCWPVQKRRSGQRFLHRSLALNLFRGYSKDIRRAEGRMVRVIAVSIVSVLILIGGGCQVVSPPPSWSSAGAGHTHLLHLPGIGGDSPFDRWWISALRDGGAAEDVPLDRSTGPESCVRARQAY